jgi:hypothetical protein
MIIDWCLAAYQQPTNFECERYMTDNRLGPFAHLTPLSKMQADVSEPNVEGPSVVDSVASNSKYKDASVEEPEKK